MCTLYYFQPHPWVSYLKELCCLVIFRRENGSEHFQPVIPVLLPGQAFLSHSHYGGSIDEAFWESVIAHRQCCSLTWVLPPVQGWKVDELCRAPSTASTVGPRETSKSLFSNTDVCFWVRTSLLFPVVTRNGRQKINSSTEVFPEGH